MKKICENTHSCLYLCCIFVCKVNCIKVHLQPMYIIYTQPTGYLPILRQSNNTECFINDEHTCLKCNLDNFDIQKCGPQ